jgi:hypothetical protein
MLAITILSAMVAGLGMVCYIQSELLKQERKKAEYLNNLNSRIKKLHKECLEKQ